VKEGAGRCSLGGATFLSQKELFSEKKEAGKEEKKARKKEWREIHKSWEGGENGRQEGVIVETFHGKKN